MSVVELAIYEEIGQRCYTVVSLFTGMQCLANSGSTSRWSSTRTAEDIFKSGIQLSRSEIGHATDFVRQWNDLGILKCTYTSGAA